MLGAARNAVRKAMLFRRPQLAKLSSLQSSLNDLGFRQRSTKRSCARGFSTDGTGHDPVDSTTTTAPNQQRRHFCAEDEELTESKRRVTMEGVSANLFLAASKSTVGLISGSASLLADGLHSLSDLASDAVTLGVLKLTQKPADHKYPFGYGRFDTLGTLVIGSTLVGGSAIVGFSAVETMIDYFTTVHNDHAVYKLESWHYAAPALGIALFSIGVKEMLYRRTLRIGQKSRSSVIVANAWHHRSDAFSSVVAAAGISGAILGLPWLDSIGGVVVSAYIVKFGAEMVWDSLRELTDASVESNIVEQVQLLSKNFMVRCHMVKTTFQLHSPVA